MSTAIPLETIKPSTGQTEVFYINVAQPAALPAVAAVATPVAAATTTTTTTAAAAADDNSVPWGLIIFSIFLILVLLGGVAYYIIRRRNAQKQPAGTACTTGDTCQSGACGVIAPATTTVCCATSPTVPVGGAQYCGSLPAGSVCTDKSVCSSGTCTSGKCS